MLYESAFSQFLKNFLNEYPRVAAERREQFLKTQPSRANQKNEEAFQQADAPRKPYFYD